MTGNGERSGHQQALEAGTRFAGLTVSHVLGYGNFGITYKALDDLGQVFVIKEFFPVGLVMRDITNAVVPISPEKAEAFEAGKESFRKEAEILSQLDHPNIVKVIGFFDHGGTAYFTMPWYEGMGLHEFLARGATLSPEEARAFTEAMVDALGYLHARQIYHRDIKPANVFVTAAEGRPILLDFGAAKQSLAEGTSLHTRVGTEHYRAPEQTASRGNIGPWTDIYGLCATLYRMITSARPEDSADRLDCVSNGQPDPLKTLIGFPNLARDFDPAFLAAITAGLNVRRVDRPQNVDELQAIFAGKAQPRPVMQAAPGPAGTGAGDWHQPGSEPELARLATQEERTPWGRYMVLGAILMCVLGAGVWLALNTIVVLPKGEDVVTMAPSGEVVDVELPSDTLTDNEAWVRALEADTLEAYREYLELFPEGRHAEDAQAEIDTYDEADWARALQRDTIPGYEDYLADWPEGLHAEEARAIIETRQQAAADAAARAEELARQEAADWARATELNTVASYQAYLDKHPGGPNASEARRLMEAIQRAAADDAAFAQAEALHTSAAYDQYLQSFPQGRHAMAAQAALEILRPAPGKVIRDCAECPPMVVLPSGSQPLGAPDTDPDASAAEKPQRPVMFSEIFAMSVTEVTFDQWQPCVDDGACAAVPSDGGWGRGNRPVINVSWQQANAYANWLAEKTGQAYSLPTEAQWEYAARAGDTGVYPGGSLAAVCAFANGAGGESGMQWANGECRDPAAASTLPVGALAPNAFGLRDMIGNVGEWTLDCNTLNLRDAPSDGRADMRGSCGQRAVRGGSWFSGPRDMRYTARLMQRTGDSNDFTGVRVVRAISG